MPKEKLDGYVQTISQILLTLEGVSVRGKEDCMRMAASMHQLEQLGQKLVKEVNEDAR